MHPNQSMLDEFQFAIHHFVSTLPDQIKKQAQELHDKLLANENATEDDLKQVFYEIGVKEYPYRKAYEELTSSVAEPQIKVLVIDHVDEKVRSLIKPHLDSGVTLAELVSSDFFTEQLTPEQRYQVEDGILVAKSKLADQMKHHVSGHQAQYDELVAKWTKQAEAIEAALQKLEAMSQKGDENQKQEIINKTQRYREGFLVTEKDPELPEIQKEIEYWQETLEKTEVI